jgi:hypothetical protein
VTHEPKIFPVIHHHYPSTTLNEADVAFKCGADGVFLISHGGQDNQIVRLAVEIKQKYPNWLVGVNLLSHRVLDAAWKLVETPINMLWADYAGISSAPVNPEQVTLLKQALDGRLLFAGVAFKGQDPEPNPAVAALNALRQGFIPTTSGERTGVPPTVEKIVHMSLATNGKLAVASGMTLDNVADYSTYLSHILVSTGICDASDAIIANRLKRLIANAKKRGP